mmetsp:Transcript_61385/g.110458  ORF Transcript_61385/g.110458 Transcript_61385/m.110458 type:complete len:220 (-) Transcript_61385:96-755(-)
MRTRIACTIHTTSPLLKRLICSPLKVASLSGWPPGRSFVAGPSTPGDVNVNCDVGSCTEAFPPALPVPIARVDFDFFGRRWRGSAGWKFEDPKFEAERLEDEACDCQRSQLWTSCDMARSKTQAPGGDKDTRKATALRSSSIKDGCRTAYSRLRWEDLQTRRYIRTLWKASLLMIFWGKASDRREWAMVTICKRRSSSDTKQPCRKASSDWKRACSTTE